VGPRRLYRPMGVKTPGYSLLFGSFTTAGTGAPTVVDGAGFTVSAPSTGVYTITISDGRCSKAIGMGLDLEDSTTNANDTVRWGDLDAVATAGTFTIITASAAGTDADLTGPRVHFCVALRNTGLTK
jgi:hypothetical protein